MELLHLSAIFFALFVVAESYSKYGRSCKDIGCLTNEVCVMETDPCSYYQRSNECGAYPTCKKKSDGTQRTCATYVCPPTKVCKMDGNTPKCVDDHSKTGFVRYDTSEPKNENSQGAIYPNVPRGQTTPRPYSGYQPAAGGQGYQGGQIGSGYPGQSRPANYPQQPPYYPQQPYPGQNQGGYPGQGGYNGYPQQGQQPQGGYSGYPQQGQGGQQGYPGQYPNQGGYNPYQTQNRYGGGYGSGAQPSGGIVDSLTNALKKYGTDILKNAIANSLRNNNNH